MSLSMFGILCANCGSWTWDVLSWGHMAVYVSRFGVPRSRIVFSFDQSHALSMRKGSWREVMTLSTTISSWIMSGVMVVLAVVGSRNLNHITGRLMSLRRSNLRLSFEA